MCRKTKSGGHTSSADREKAIAAEKQAAEERSQFLLFENDLV